MHALSSSLALTALLLYQYGGGLGYYSNMASGSVIIPTWRRTRALSFGPTNYEQCLHLSEWVSDTFAYRSPRNKHVSTRRVATNLKNGVGKFWLLVWFVSDTQLNFESWYSMLLFAKIVITFERRKN